MTAAAAPTAPSPPGWTWARGLLRAVAGPVICAVVLTGLLAAWVAAGGAGTLTRVRLQVTLAAVPMRAFTPRAAAAVGAATTFLAIKNLTGTPDELVAASSPIAGRVTLDRTQRPYRAQDGDRRSGRPRLRDADPEPVRR